MENKDTLDKFDLNFKPAPSTSSSSYIIDKILVKGVTFDRNENDSNLDYLYVDTHEN